MEVMQRRAPRIGSVERAILMELLLIGDQHLTGYDLILRLKLQSGSVYPALHRLAEHGLIDEDAEPRSRRRKLYTLTPEGREVLGSLIAANRRD
jgi:DNA-binding PadR family transcriptional regulator